MTSSRSLALSLLAGTLAWAQAPATPAAPAPQAASKPEPEDARKIVPIPDDQKVIEEASLLKDASLQGTEGMKGKLASFYDPNDPAGGHFDPAKGKIVHDTPESELQDDAPTALRLYGFKLKPGEEIKFKLTADSSGQISMGFPLPKNPGAMMSQLKRANGLNKSIRFRRINLENITKEPYAAVLMLKGQPGYKFKLEIERSGGK